MLKTDRTFVFIDGANTHAACNCAGFDIDYRKFSKWLVDTYGNIRRKIYFTAIIEEEEYTPIRPLVDYLEFNGFGVVTKATKSFVDERGARKIKGNMDLEMAVEIFDVINVLDHAILLTGDGDFRSVVEAIQRRGVFVTVISEKGKVCAEELRRQADNFINLSTLSSILAKDRR